MHVAPLFPYYIIPLLKMQPNPEGFFSFSQKICLESLSNAKKSRKHLYFGNKFVIIVKNTISPKERTMKL